MKPALPYWVLALILGVGALVFGVIGHSLWAAADPTDPHVSSRDGTVSNQGAQADKIDIPGAEDVKAPGYIEVGPTITLIQSLHYTPPVGWGFSPFSQPNPWKYVDIHNKPPDSIQKRVVAPSSQNDTASCVRIEGEFDKASVPAWPLRCEGNLVPPAGSQGGQPHWAAKIGVIPIYAAFDPHAIRHGDRDELIAYLVAHNWTKQDDKTYTKGTFIVHIMDMQAEVASALSADEESYIAVCGHSNFGLGYNFTGFNNTRIADFMQCAEACVPIDWIYMRLHQDHPNFVIDKATEYGDDPDTNIGGQRDYDPMYRAFTVTGKYFQFGFVAYYRWANKIAGGDGHAAFQDPDNVPNENDNHVEDTTDMPHVHAHIGAVTPGTNNIGNGTLGGTSIDDRYAVGGNASVRCKDASTPPGQEEWEVFMWGNDGNGFAMGTAVTGVQFTSNDQALKFTITAGTTPFARDDSYVIGISEADLRLVAVCGAGEMPQSKKWKTILLDSCFSAKYYSNIFNHGTLFFTRNMPLSGNGAIVTYVDCIVKGKSNDEIWVALENCRTADQKRDNTPVYDYHVFGQ